MRLSPLSDLMQIGCSINSAFSIALSYPTKKLEKWAKLSSVRKLTQSGSRNTVVRQTNEYKNNDFGVLS